MKSTLKASSLLLFGACLGLAQDRGTIRGTVTDQTAVRKTLREFDGIWSEMTPREQEKFVKTLVERVSHDGATAR